MLSCFLRRWNPFDDETYYPPENEGISPKQVPFQRKNSLPTIIFRGYLSFRGSNGSNHAGFKHHPKKGSKCVCFVHFSFVMLAGNNCLADLEKNQGFPDLEKTRFSALHTEKLTWNLKITFLKRKIIF